MAEKHSTVAPASPGESTPTAASSTATPEPRKRGRPRKTNPQFPGTVIRFDSRPRFAVGDVVELCRGCLPGNRGKLAVITDFDDEGFAILRSIWQSLDAIDIKTGEVTPNAGLNGRIKPESLYRRSSALAPKTRRHA